MSEIVNFTQMKDGSLEDYQLLEKLEEDYAKNLPERLLAMLRALDESLSGYKISRLSHSLQSATRAWRDGADLDWVISTLMHDTGDIYAPYNHDSLAASIVKPYVREQCTWVLETHGIFQKIYYIHHYGGNPEERQQFVDHPYFDDNVIFCERWDQSSFDPDYKTLPLEFFEPMLREVFTRKPWQNEFIRPGERVPLMNEEIAKSRQD